MFAVGEKLPDGVRVGLVESRGHVILSTGRRAILTDYALNPRFDIRCYHHWSADPNESDFDWGKMNAGAAQLSIALLSLVTDVETTLKLHGKFAIKVVAKMSDSWSVNKDGITHILRKL